MAHPREPTPSNWSHIENQLTKKLTQLTMLLHHFATSTNEEEVEESPRMLSSEIQIILKDATSQILNFKDFVQYNAQEKYNTQILQDSMIQHNATIKKYEEEIIFNKLQMKNREHFLQDMFEIYQKSSNDRVQKLQRDIDCMKTLQIQQMKIYQATINETKLIIKDHEDSHHIVIQLVLNEREKVTKRINDLIIEFRKEMSASKQSYFDKLKSFQKVQNIKIKMITNCFEDMRVNHGAKIKHLKDNCNNSLQECCKRMQILESKWQDQMGFLKEFKEFIENLSPIINAINSKVRNIFLAYTISIIILEKNLFTTRNKLFHSKRKLKEMQLVNGTNQNSLSDEKEKIKRLQCDVKTSYKNMEELMFQNKNLKNKVILVQHELDAKKEENERTKLDLNIKFKNLYSQSLSFLTRIINSMKYLSDAIDAVFKKQYEVEMTIFVKLKDAHNLQLKRDMSKWTNHINLLEIFIKEKIDRNDSVILGFKDEHFKIIKTLKSGFERRVNRTESFSSKCFTKLLEVEDKIEELITFGAHKESTFESFVTLFSKHIIVSREAYKAFVFMLKNLEIKYSNVKDVVNYSHAINEQNMEKIITDLSLIKDITINEKLKHQKNIVTCYTTFSTRLDELQHMFSKQDVVYHQSLKELNEHDKDIMEHALASMRKKTDTKIERIIKHALLSEYKLWNYYYNENCSYHSLYAGLFLDIKTMFEETSKEILLTKRDLNSLNEELLEFYKLQSMSNNRFIEDSNKKLEKLNIIHKQILMDHISKQSISVGICVKAWEDQFQCQIYGVYNQYSKNFQNMKNRYNEDISLLNSKIYALEAYVLNKDKHIEDLSFQSKDSEDFLRKKIKLKDNCNVLIVSLLESQRALAKIKTTKILSEMSTNHSQNIKSYKDGLIQYQNECKNKETILEGQLMALQKRFENRESRADDIASLMNLQKTVSLKDIKLKKVVDENKMMKLELHNREDNYNKIFGNTLKILEKKH